MKYRLYIFASLVFLAMVSAAVLPNQSSVAAVEKSSPENGKEEQLIRSAYFKLSLYNAAANKDDAEGKLARYEPKNDINFEVRNIHTGPISEILDKNLYDMTTYPNGDIIQITRSNITFKEDTEAYVGYRTQWQVGHYTSAVVPKNISIKETFNSLGSQYADVGKYSSYEVTVQLGNRLRTYKAILLYHTPNYSTSDLKPDFWDWVSGSGGVLNEVLAERKPLIGSQRTKNFIDKPDSKKGISTKNIPNEQPSSETQKTFFDCGSDQPICCPKSASSLTQCCWNPSYPYSNPGLLQNCSNSSGNSYNNKASSLYQPFTNLNVVTATSACTQDVRIGSPESWADSGTKDHIGGSHSYSLSLQGICKQDANCYRSCSITTSTNNFSDTAIFTIFWLFHYGKLVDTDERGGAFGSNSLTCKKSNGVGVMGCFIPQCGGSVTVGLPSGSSGSGSVTVSGGELWNKGWGLVMQCDFSGTIGGGSGGPPACGTGTGLYCSQGNSFCLPYTFPSGNCCCSMSPIVIDISRYWDWATNSGNGYRFTDAAGGVRFDLDGNGVKEQVGWPTATSENAWLVLDRNGNGVIDSGKELFGNFTDQVGPYGEPVPIGQGNGWLALAEYDRGRSGGNESGGIDAGDAAFPNLRLWVDRNHNGISEPNELITLSSIGITGIELGYDALSGWTDQYGNNFKLRSRFKWGDMNDPESFYTEWYKDAWDVFPLWIP